MTDLSAWQGVAVALAGGLLVGAERERSQAGQGAAAGVRTFGAVALLGAVAALVDPLAVGVALGAVAALVTVSYARTSERDPGLTSEASLLAVAGLGALAPTYPSVSAGGAVAMTVLLAGKDRLHEFVRRGVSDVELADALKFFVAAFIVLPLLPRSAVGPYDVVVPYRVWALVVAVTAISWVGYLAVRLIGPRRGLLVAGLAGGFVSSAATTGAMAARARNPAERDAAVGGALASSVSTFVQLGIVTALASTAVTRRLALGLTVGAVLAAAAAWLAGARGSGKGVPAAAGPAADTTTAKAADPPEPDTQRPTEHPFALGPAVLLATVITAVLVLARWGESTFGAAGVVGVAALAGLADVHAVSLGIAGLVAQGQVDLDTAVLAIVAALLTNTVTKLVAAGVAGGLRVAGRIAAYLAPLTGVAAAVALLG